MRAFETSGVLVLLLPLICAYAVLLRLRRAASALRLLEDGRLEEATYVSSRPLTGRTVGSQPAYELSFEFEPPPEAGSARLARGAPLRRRDGVRRIGQRRAVTRGRYAATGISRAARVPDGPLVVPSSTGTPGAR